MMFRPSSTFSKYNLPKQGNVVVSTPRLSLTSLLGLENNFSIRVKVSIDLESTGRENDPPSMESNP